MSAKNQGIVIETVEGFLCTNEGCDQHRIPRHFTQKNIDRQSGEQVVTALCDSCGTLYRISRRLYGGTWADAKVEVITDERRKASFRRRIEHVQGVIQREALSA